MWNALEKRLLFFFRFRLSMKWIKVPEFALNWLQNRFLIFWLDLSQPFRSGMKMIPWNSCLEKCHPGTGFPRKKKCPLSFKKKNINCSETVIYPPKKMPKLDNQGRLISIRFYTSSRSTPSTQATRGHHWHYQVAWRNPPDVEQSAPRFEGF